MKNFLSNIIDSQKNISEKSSKLQSLKKYFKGSIFAVLLGTSSGVVASISHDKPSELSNEFSQSEIQALQVYKVQAGDTLSHIAQRNKISLKELISYNPSKADSKNHILVGEKIYIPIKINENPEDGASYSPVIIGKKEEEYSEEKELETKKEGKKPEDTLYFQDLLFQANQNGDVSLENIYKYAELNYPEEKNQQKMIELYVRDFKIYENNFIMQQLSSLEVIVSEEEDRKIGNIFSSVGYDGLQAVHLGKITSIIESSAGLGVQFIQQALQTSSKSKRTKLIHKAVRNLVGKDGDAGYFHMTTPWIEHEITKSQSENIVYESDRKVLVKKMYEIVEYAYLNNYSPEDVLRAFSKIDSRFHLETSSSMLGKWFLRMYEILGEYSIDEDVKYKLIQIAYNRGEGTMKKLASRIEKGAKLKISGDLEKRLAVTGTYFTREILLASHRETQQQENRNIEHMFPQFDIQFRVASVLEKSGISQKKSEILAKKYTDFDTMVGGLESAFKVYSEGIITSPNVTPEMLKRLETLIDSSRNIQEMDVINILGLDTNMSQNQREIVRKIIDKNGSTPEKVLQLLQATRRYYFHLSEKYPNQTYKTFVLKLDQIIGDIESKFYFEKRNIA